MPQKSCYNNAMDEMLDDELKKVCQSRAVAKIGAMADFLERVALDPSYTDKRLTKDKLGTKLVDVPIPVNVRVSAAKIWKEIVADKAVGDVKEKAKEKRDRTVDMRRVLEELGEESKKSLDKLHAGEEGDL